jgi:hypothetical protein
MGRFSWGVRAKSRKETSSIPSETEEVELGKGDATPSPLPTPWTTPRYLWMLGLCVTALFGYFMEATPARIGNAMFSNHLFSEYRAPRRLHMTLLHSRRASLSTVSLQHVNFPRCLVSLSVLVLDSSLPWKAIVCWIEVGGVLADCEGPCETVEPPSQQWMETLSESQSW